MVFRTLGLHKIFGLSGLGLRVSVSDFFGGFGVEFGFRAKGLGCGDEGPSFFNR